MIDDLSATGITGIPSVAEHLADFGRFGDGYFVHATEGEAIVPLPVLDENPRLKEALFTQMREMDLEPERYIVGNELNSINPITGQPEFFLKKFFRGAKNVLKAIAPVVLPIVLAGTKLGPILGSTAGIGIARALQGKGLDRIASDMFKTAGITTLISALSPDRSVLSDLNFKKRGSEYLKGVNRFNPFSESFLDSGAKAPITGPSGALDGQEAALSALDTGELSEALVEPGARTIPFQDFDTTTPPVSRLGPPGSTITPGALGGSPDQLTPRLASLTNPYQVNYLGRPGLPPQTLSGLYTGPSEAVNQLLAESAQASVIPSGADALSTAIADINSRPTGFLSNVRAGRWGDAFLPPDVTATELLEKYPGLSPAAAQSLAEDASPGYLRKYLPLTALGLGAASLFGAFDDPDEPEPVSIEELERQLGPTAGDLVAANPVRYRTGIPTYSPVSLSSVRVPTAYGADGGSVGFPRRIGAIAGGGTGTSDNVPAMLSDGEYVMTAKAVRGAGNGNRKQGMRNMYDMMRQFEGQVA